MTPARVYLDYNAGAPLRPEARAAMIEALDAGGNASSVHAEGRAARGRIERARAKVAALVGADPRRVTFTSGGTEANATVLRSAFLVAGKRQLVDGCLVGATDHLSVTAGGRFQWLEPTGVDRNGVLDLERLEEQLSLAKEWNMRLLVSVMLANNETGTIQPVVEVAALARRYGAFSHSDVAQAMGRIPVSIEALGVDFITFSSHKIGGPQGAGAVVARSGEVAIEALLTGGAQEKGMRAGTENVPAIAGFGAAAGVVPAELESLVPRWRQWRDRTAAALKSSTPGLVLISADADRLPQTLSVAVPGIPAETLVIGLDLEGVSLSSGAACSSGKVGPSGVLRAMRVAPEVERGAVRISFGWETTENDLDMFQSAWKRVVGRIRAAQGRAA